MNRLTLAKRAQIVASVVEGNSLRATARMCDVAFNSVLRMLPQIGAVCADYHSRTIRNLTSRRIKGDEI